MYRLIIIDDAPRERRGIQEIIDWGDLGIQVTGAYSNGAKAMEDIGLCTGA